MKAEKITPQEVKSWLASLDSVRFKEISSDHLYDVIRVGEDLVMVRPASPYPDEDVYIIPIDVFVEKFDEYLGPQIEY